MDLVKKSGCKPELADLKTFVVVGNEYLPGRARQSPLIVCAGDDFVEKLVSRRLPQNP